MTTTPLVDKGEDASERDDRLKEPGSARRWMAGGAVLTIAAAGVLVAVKPWAGQETSASPISDSSAPPASNTNDAPVANDDGSHQLALATPPDDFAVQWVEDPFQRRGPEPGVDVARPIPIAVDLYAAEGSTIGKGPWLSTSVQLLDRFERRAFDPMNYVDQSVANEVSVGGLKGAISENFDDTLTVLWGPVNEGYAVQLSARGLSSQQLVTLAAGVTLEENADGAEARVVLGDRPPALDLPLYASYSVESWGFGGGLLPPFGLGGSPMTTTVGYTVDDGAGFLNVANTPLDDAEDVMRLARFYLDEANEVTIGALTGLAGTMPAAMGGGEVVLWLNGTRLVTVTGSLDGDDLVPLANDVALLGDDEWAALFEAAQQNDGGAPEGGVIEAWVIGVGELSTSETWIIEGSFDEDDEEEPEFVLCAVSSLEGMGMSSSGCSETVAAKVPSLQQGPRVGTVSGYPSVIAFGDPKADDLVLRFTAADGSVDTRPLTLVRREWPFVAAALVVEKPGTVELTDGAGTVLDTYEIDETTIPDPNELGNGEVTVSPTIDVGG
jgi:hypothetical protein